jgi:hypothetical protein
LQQHFDFPIDSWQARSGGRSSWLETTSLFVRAPSTGAGKTVVGEMALHRAFHSDPGGAVVTHHTPLKALSNQTHAESRKIVGPKNVGKSTGDMSVNLGARIVVMTPIKVHRNMAWRAMDVSVARERPTKSRPCEPRSPPKPAATNSLGFPLPQEIPCPLCTEAALLWMRSHSEPCQCGSQCSQLAIKISS